MNCRLVCTIRLAGLCWLLLSCSSAKAADTAAKEEGENLIPNASFETAAKNNQPARWRTQRWGGEATTAYADVAHTGKRSVLIASEKGADESWGTTVPVEPQAKYRLSAWIKTEDVKAGSGRGALLNLHNLQPVATKALTGTNDWTRVEVEFQTEDHDALQINCLLGGWGLSTGKAWFDDVRLEQTGKSKAAGRQPGIAIDAAKTGQPISKYIYGQFIEHLGRCIYGGIWAEMLEDRKFFYPVGAKESPWKIIGPADAVKMDREKPFVGQHSPQIALSDDQPRGIAQSGLGLIAGKDYVGRVRLDRLPDLKVALVWGDGPKERQAIAPSLTKSSTGTMRLNAAGSYNGPADAEKRQSDPAHADYGWIDLKFTAGATTDNARLEITATGKGSFHVGPVSLMPADNVHGMRADTLALLKELDSPVYRWPGGNFVSGYDWRDGIGDPDRRPPRKNPAWTGIEHNDFGIDEFMLFCKLLKTEPYIAVNSGLGDVKNAVAEMEYANGAADTPMGKLRAKNGHPEPYKVKFWGIGNEMYGNWQLGHMPLEKYVAKHNEFAKAMRAVDPSAQLVAVGAVGKWSETMMAQCADHMDLVSEHFYCQEQPGIAQHTRLIPNAVRRIAEAHRKYRREIEALKGKDIRIALDEWNYWYGPHVFGELGTRYFVKDGLGIAAGLNEYARQSDIYFMANYAQTVNVIGCIKTNKTAAAFETTGLVLKLYRQHFGVVPAATETTGTIDAVAAWTTDRKALTLAVVNPGKEATQIPLKIEGAALSGKGTRWQIAHGDPLAYNDPAQPAKIKIEESPVTGVGDKITVAPYSVMLLSLEVK
jgi:alpha-N-arabinofuranosidase